MFLKLTQVFDELRMRQTTMNVCSAVFLFELSHNKFELQSGTEKTKSKKQNDKIWLRLQNTQHLIDAPAKFIHG